MIRNRSAVTASSPMRRRTILSLLFAAPFTLVADHALARVNVVVGIPPPAPLVETPPLPPPGGYVWQPGYWSWDGVRYVWVPGAYIARPRPYAVWVPGRWVRRGGGWFWIAGRWG